MRPLPEETCAAFRADLNDPRHGTYTAYCNYACRCDRCRESARLRALSCDHWKPKRRERAERALVAFVRDDLTTEQISQRVGSSASQIRKDLRALDPTLYALAKRRRFARTRLRALERRIHRRDNRPVVIRSCALCGEPFEVGKAQAYCSPIHQAAAMSLRYQTDPDHYEIHRKRIADWTLRNADHEVVDDIRLRHAERVAAGEETKVHGRWLIPGSLPFHWALRAYSGKWPIWERFHPDVQQQIREWVSENELAAVS